MLKSESMALAGYLMLNEPGCGLLCGKQCFQMEWHRHKEIVGRTDTAGVAVLDAAYLIPFKAKVWIDLSERKASGACRFVKHVL